MTDNHHLRRTTMASLVLASRQWRKLAQQALADHGISQARATALVWVHRLGGGVRQITLAGYVGIEGTTLVRLLDELTTAGLLVRREDSEDRRAKTIWLTAEGEKLAESIEDVLEDLSNRVLGEMEAEDLEATKRLCKTVCRMADRSVAELDHGPGQTVQDAASAD